MIFFSARDDVWPVQPPGHQDHPAPEAGAAALDPDLRGEGGAPGAGPPGHHHLRGQGE